MVRADIVERNHNYTRRHCHRNSWSRLGNSSDQSYSCDDRSRPSRGGADPAITQKLRCDVVHCCEFLAIEPRGISCDGCGVSSQILGRAARATTSRSAAPSHIERARESLRPAQWSSLVAMALVVWPCTSSGGCGATELPGRPP